MTAALGVSKGAIGSYLSRARTAGLSWPLPEGLSDTELERRCSRVRRRPRLAPAGRRRTGRRWSGSCGGAGWRGRCCGRV